MILTVSVVGGEGKMGKLIAHTLSQQGMRVHSIGRNTKNKKQNIASSHAVLFSVPLLTLKKTLRALHKKELANKLLVDCSSLVLVNKSILKKYSKNTAFIHCLFGPNIDNLNGKGIVALKQEKKVDIAFEALLDAFTKQGARIVRATHKEHDEIMAHVQALSQFNAIALAKTLQESGVTRSTLDDFSTLTFSLSAALIERITEQSLWNLGKLTDVVPTGAIPSLLGHQAGRLSEGR